ncbi:Crp/Fnr family transcriptional regulator [Flavobacterium jejuense]|uniref:Crp/Fnr family transcriptional regulator n=1 Tax=Flavobacterium jejuense TaxID=1544455 RepID=A0ABX0IUW7_9FLAO|nr:Crp/Fnr family transcriptional regulator [Flavobacterium jejuense]NHN27710.1 Crp/Fnr family transcriptional regulator [Flavobacterium jejuense]
MNSIWYFEDVDLFNIMCPHKFKDAGYDDHFKNYKKNDFIYSEDAAADKIYLINSGKIKIGYVNDEGDEVISAILSKGEIFGEKAILGEEKRNEFAVVLENNTSICPIAADQMLELIRGNRELSLKIYKFIGFRLKRLERRLKLLLFKDTKTRLKEYLNELALDYGYKNTISGDTVIRHPFTQKEIASLIGTSRPTLNILINELQEEGYLNFDRKEIILKNS